MNKLTNTGDRPEGGYDRHGRAFLLAPGESREVLLSKSYAATLRRRKGALRIAGEEPAPKVAAKAEVKPVDPAAGSGGSDNPARDLLARAGDLHHATLRSEAAKIIGAENTPAKKEDILAELTILAEG